MAQLIDGKVISKKIRDQIKEGVSLLKQERLVTPGLATILVGDDPASHVYVRNKNKACEEAGMISRHHHLPGSTSEEELLHHVRQLNADPLIHGILVQLPLPKQINASRVLDAVLPTKDVDGFHPINMGNLFIGRPGLKPCTPFGVMRLLEEIGFDVIGKHAVVIGRSNIVGKPVSMMLLQANATVTICHSKTKKIEEIVRLADLIVAAVGIPHFVKGNWVKKGAVVIDVGINRLPDGKLAGDVDFEEAAKNASFITPVPGGVGPMTIAMLLWNTLEAAKGIST